MPHTKTPAAVAAKYRRLGCAAAGSILLIAVACCIALWSRTAEFESTALLSYIHTEDGDSVPVSSPTAAASVLDDAHLALVLDEQRLYEKLRQDNPESIVVGHFRSEIALKQPNPSTLRLSFRGEDAAQSQRVASALLELLSASGNTAATASSQPSNGSLQSGPESESVTDGVHEYVNPPQATDSNHGSFSREHTRKMMDKLSARMAALTKENTGLQEEASNLQGRISLIQNSTGAARNDVQPQRKMEDSSSMLRAQIAGLIASEEQKLTALRARYTNEYPEVQTESEDLARLKVRLAALPPATKAAEPVAPATVYQGKLDDLTAEQSRLSERMRRNERENAKLQKRREEVEKALPESILAAPILPARPMQTAPITSIAHASTHFPASRFVVLRVATPGVRINGLTERLLLWIVLITAILAGICLLPAFLAKGAVIVTAEDMKILLPCHAAFLGRIRRIEF